MLTGALRIRAVTFFAEVVGSGPLTANIEPRIYSLAIIFSIGTFKTTKIIDVRSCAPIYP